MSNPEHEARLRQGVDEWNRWRDAHPDLRPELDGIRWTRAELSSANLENTVLEGTSFIRARFVSANLRGANLRKATLIESDLTEADLTGADLSGAQLNDAVLRGACLASAKLPGAVLTWVDAPEADFAEADLSGADLRESQFRAASFERANLDRAELFKTNLRGASFLGTRGLTEQEIVKAFVDEGTRLPEELAETQETPSMAPILEKLRAIQAKSESGQIPESIVHTYHGLLDQLEALGTAVSEARIEDEVLVRPVTSWDGTPGGEAFEVDPTRWVEEKHFKAALDRLWEAVRGADPEHRG